MLRELFGFAEALAVAEPADAPSLLAGMLSVRAAFTATTSTNQRVADWHRSVAEHYVGRTRLPVQRRLARMLSAIGDLDVLTCRLIAVGIRLHMQERYSAAIDVFEAVYDMSSDPDAQLQAVYRRAFALRMLARFEEAAAAYSTLELEASKAGNDHMMLEARLGHAKLASNRGNVPDAIARVERVIMCADYMHDHAMHAKALAERACLAGQARDARGVVRFGTRAMQMLDTRTDRNRCGLNVAIAHRELGRHAESRCMAIRVRDDAVDCTERALAIVLLYHLATDGDDDAEQGACHEALASATSPIVVIERHEAIGRAMAARGDFTQSRAAYETMLDLAQHHKYGEAGYRAEVALQYVARRRVPPVYDYNPPRFTESAVTAGVNALTARVDIPGASIPSDLGAIHV